jgi:SHS family sialic acid transporter-like MFS transporter
MRLFSKRWITTTVVVTIFLFAASGMNYPILALLPTYLKSIGYDPKAVGSIMSIANIGGLVGFCASGFFADWFGLRRAVILSLVISLGFLGAAFLIGQSSILIVGVLMFLLLFTNLGITGLWPKYVTQYFDPDVRSSGLGLTYNIGSLAGGISPVLGASLQSALGLGGAIGLLTTFWTLVVIFIVATNLPDRVTSKAADRFRQMGTNVSAGRI